MSPAIISGVRWGAFLLVLACGRQPPPGDEGRRPAATTDSASDSSLPVDTPSVQQPTIRPGAPPNEAVDPRPIAVPGNKQKAVLSVSELGRDASLTGTVVTVRGTCLRRGAGQAEGAPPLTRSDWELGEDGRAVWVSGPRPPDCPAESGAKVSGVARGLVQVDTLRMLDGTERPRVYMVVDQSQ
jgi:hypothetical protein